MCVYVCLLPPPSGMWGEGGNAGRYIPVYGVCLERKGRNEQGNPGDGWMEKL